MTDFFISPTAIKGRGSASRIAHRFESDSRAAFDDGWQTQTGLLAEQQASAKLLTEVRHEQVKSVITSHQSPDLALMRSVNPYRGCEHGCIYCYARPTHSYLGMSPGLDFETKLIAKTNLAEVLQKELARSSYQVEPISIGSATDCYQPIERELRLTRQVIELFSQTAHPMGIVTKSSGVERDIDLLAPMGVRQLAVVYVTITTLNAPLARQLEPRAASPARRLETIRRLHQAGVPVGVSLAPQIPFITDDMEQVLEAAAQAGASSAFYSVLRLPWEVAPLFREWLTLHFPDRAARVMARIADMRGGKDYDSAFFSRMQGTGLWAELIAQRFSKACARLGLNRQRFTLDHRQFVPPVQPRAGAVQGQLF